MKNLKILKKFLNPNCFLNLIYICSRVKDLGNLQEQVKKAFRFKYCIHCMNKLFWWSNLFANSRSWALDFKKKIDCMNQFFSQSFRTIFETKYHFWEKGQEITRNRRWYILECQKGNRIFRAVSSSFWLENLKNFSSIPSTIFCQVA